MVLHPFRLHRYVQTESNIARWQRCGWGISGKRLIVRESRSLYGIPAELCQISSGHWTRLPKWKCLSVRMGWPDQYVRMGTVWCVCEKMRLWKPNLIVDRPSISIKFSWFALQIAIPNLASSFLIILHCFSLKAGAGESGLWDRPISYIFETSHPNRGGIPRDTAS
jgi:hypothetical protein